MGHSKGSVTGIMKFLITVAALLQSPSVAVIFVMMELVQSVMMVPKLSTTDQQERVLMAQSVSVQEVERTANSTTEYVAMDKDAGRCAAGDNHTALGGPGTGTSTMASGSSTLVIQDQATRDTTGDLTLLEANHEG